MARRRRWRRVLVIAAVLLVAVLVAGGVSAYAFLTRNEPVVYSNIVEQYKYGSLGTEERQGLPYLVWAVMPTVFPDLLPNRPGNGYARFGLTFEKGHARPIGTTSREKPVELTSLNCAVCHTGTYRATPNGTRHIVLGMPANRLRLEEYINFFRAAVHDKRFNADTILKAVDERFPGRLSFFDRVLYRYVVIPEMKKGIEKVDRDFRWSDSRPEYGPGRVDTFNPVKVLGHFDLSKDHTIGTVDFPSIWNQRTRESSNLHFHWDGNNSSLLERNISAARASGATDDSLDMDQMMRIAKFVRDLPPPRYPRPIDRPLAERGESVYTQQCASCHDLGGKLVGQVTPIAQIGTDRHRLDSFTPALAAELNRDVGKGKWWHFSHFRKTHGYANLLLDGLWLRAPYLHNGSVPSLRALLFPKERPIVFFTGYDVYDWKDVGFVSKGPAARREGFRYDTRLPGNGNQGHPYGTNLPAADRLALIEYLKTK